MLTVANISAAKQAKDAGEEAPKKMELNEFADMTFDEYESMNNDGVGGETETEGDVSILETVMLESAAQDAASASLQEAAAAIAEEEQVRNLFLFQNDHGGKENMKILCSTQTNKGTIEIAKDYLFI